MVITQKNISDWEKRLPDLNETWTHWFLEDDGFFIAVIPRENINDVIDLIRAKHEQLFSIFAYRAKIGSDGKPIRQENYRYEVFNSSNDFGNNE